MYPAGMPDVPREDDEEDVELEPDPEAFAQHKAGLDAAEAFK